MEAKSKLKWLVAAMQQHPHHVARLMQWATIPGMAGVDCPHQLVCRMQAGQYLGCSLMEPCTAKL